MFNMYNKSIMKQDQSPIFDYQQNYTPTKAQYKRPDDSSLSYHLSKVIALATRINGKPKHRWVYYVTGA